MIYTREQWGAKYGRGAVGLQRRGEEVIHTAAGTLIQPSWSLDRVMQLVRDIEDFHSRPKSRGGRGWNGIAYSHLVDPVHGWAFEGRGWGRNGGHTQQGRNNSAYAICFLGHGDIQPVSEAGWAGAEFVIRDGLAHGKLTTDYVVTGHRNYANKSCPGGLIYPHIGRLRGLTLDIPAPEIPKDWLDMDESTLRRIFREELSARDYLAEHDNKQWVIREREGLAVHIKTGEDFDRLRQAFPHHGSVPSLAGYEVIA